MKQRPLHVVVVAALLATGCGGSQSATNSSAEPAPEEEWTTVQEWVLSSSERCVTGPFEVTVDDAEVEFGRRFTVEVFGPRRLPMDTTFVYADGGRQYGWGWSHEDSPEEHRACRGHGAAGASGSPTGPASTGGGGGGTPPPGGGSTPPGSRPPGTTPEEPGGPTPTLDVHDGRIPRSRTIGGGTAWYPRGKPTFSTLDEIEEGFSEGADPGGFRFQFWFHEPVDMSGMVIRLRNQLLTPTVSRERYLANFDARVAAVRERMAAATRVVDDTPRSAAVGRVPPPPRAEPVPPSPGRGAEWVSGYWRFHAELDDFIWVGGTFVVRSRQTARASAPEPAAAPSPPPAAPVAVERVVEIDDAIPPRPAPRAETIPAPPDVEGAQWVAGYWELDSRRWRWVSGHWELPAEASVRFRPPSIEVRGDVRVYLPGSWLRR